MKTDSIWTWTQSLA